jgi:ribosomal protein L10
MNSLRIDLYDENCKLLVVKKRLFLKVMSDSDCETIEHKDLE